VKGGLQVGRGESGTLQQAAGSLPPQVLQQLQQLSHDVFAYGFIDAMRPSLLVGVAVLLLGSISCLAAQRRPGSGARQPDEDAAGQSAPAA
jgi:hypothetical protein